MKGAKGEDEGRKEEMSGFKVRGDIGQREWGHFLREREMGFKIFCISQRIIKLMKGEKLCIKMNYF